MVSPFIQEITITQPLELQAALDASVAQAVHAGLANPGHGILVTRHDHRRFTIELSDRVPQGTISELDLHAPH